MSVFAIRWPSACASAFVPYLLLTRGRSLTMGCPTVALRHCGRRLVRHYSLTGISAAARESTEGTGRRSLTSSDNQATSSRGS